MPVRARVVVALSATYGLALALIGLWPTHVDDKAHVMRSRPVQWMVDHLHVNAYQAYDLVQYWSNVALFVPFGILLMALSPRVKWLWAVVTGFAVSALIELVQDLARPGRTASWDDVRANTLGAVIGATLVLGARMLIHRRQAEQAASR